MAIKLYVGNLSFQTSSEDLRDLFAQAGTVESANVVEDRDTGRSRGFGFVEMATREEGEAAIQQFNGKELGGRNLTVNEARPREDRGGSRGGGGGRGFGGGGGGGRGGGGFGGGGNRGGGGGGRGGGGFGGGSGGGGGNREPRW
jgi:RNA recognition motif-containing protein